MPANRIVTRGVTLSPEGRQIFPKMTVQENLLMGGYTRKRATLGPSFERVFELFPILKERINQQAGTLSGGEQQMLAIGRALMSSPNMLMLDEPSLGLSPILTETIFQLIEEIKNQGVTILLIEQNAFGALSIADYGYVLENGKSRWKAPVRICSTTSWSMLPTSAAAHNPPPSMTTGVAERLKMKGDHYEKVTEFLIGNGGHPVDASRLRFGGFAVCQQHVRSFNLFRGIRRR